MTKIETYSIMWNADVNEGSISVSLEGGATRMIPIDSSQEGILLLDILRNEKPVYLHDRHNQIITGIVPIAEQKSA